MAEQTPVTKQFIQQLQELRDKGIIKNYAEVIEKLKWNKSTMSSVLNGKLNVPHYIYSNFKTAYNIPDPELPKQIDPEVYKEKYIALLEIQIERYDLLINELAEIKNLLKNLL
jgi:hypothetical protein